MRLNLYDFNLNRIAIIGAHFVSCLWNEGYNTVGDFVLELQATDEYKRKVNPDCYVGRDDRKTLMVIKSVEVQGGKIIATGKQAARVLDDVALLGTVPSGVLIDTAIKNAYNNSIKYPHLRFADTNVGVKTTSQISNSSFLSVAEELCQEADVGFRVVKDADEMLMEFYQPAENPNLIFSEKYGNLIFGSVKKSIEAHKNYAIVLGEGTGGERVTVIVDKINDEQRRELVVDARDLQMEDGETVAAYKERLYSRGISRLLEQPKTLSCAFSVVTTDFGTRFDVGDIVTARLPEFGMILKSRIAKVSQKSQQNKTETTVEVGSLTIMR